jgi:hypothetical protein
MFIAADCFVPDRTAKTRLPLCPAFLSLGWLLDGAADRAAVRLFALLIIGISSVQLQHACCTTEAPQKLLRRRGEIPELQKRAGSKHSNAPITSKCQLFLDNLVAQIERLTIR